MAKYLRNELTEEEEIQLDCALNESKENRDLLESFRDTVTVQKEIDFIAQIDIDKAWKKANKKHKSPIRKKFRFIMSAAALLVCILSFFWLIPVNNKGSEILAVSKKVENDVLPASNKALLILSSGQAIYLDKGKSSLEETNGTLITGKGGELSYDNNHNQHSSNLIFNTLKVPSSGTYRLKLPDGSNVWVNAQSELRFPVQFGESERKVYLKGEAYFEVAKDASRPFRVEVDQTKVEVLGTHFNVRSYDREVATTLIEGSVKVLHEQKQVLLSPGQEAKIKAKDIQVQQVNVLKATAWKDDVFYFEGDDIQNIMDEISRWYDVDIKYVGKIPTDRYKGIVRRDVKLSEVLEMLSFISGRNFEISERSVTVKF